MDSIEHFETMLADGQDSALLRFGLGNAYLNAGAYTSAIKHLLQAIELDKNYSAAWKLYGKALDKNGQINDAIAVYESGIAIAEKNSDIQAAKEMKVFLKRLKRGLRAEG